MLVKIYVLIDPVTLKIRYIGRTQTKLNVRLNGHISKSKFKRNHKDCWIYSLREKGLKPKIKLFKIIEGWEESHKYEQSLINRCINFGFNLVNLDDRGIGGVNKILDDTQKLKISNSLKIGYKSGGIIPPNLSPVVVYDLYGNILYKFNSQKECAEYLNIHVSSIESQVSGKVKRCYKYQIRKINQPNPGIYKLTRDCSFNFKSVLVKNIKSNEKILFDSFKSAANYLSVSSPTIRRKIESRDLLRGEFSLCLNIKKSDKLLESQGIDNQQPITNLNGWCGFND